MKVAVSILSIKENIKQKLEELECTTADYIHLDIMDGEFVSNKTWNIEEINDIISFSKKPKDVHLMVDDLDKYIENFSSLNPDYITFHYEATQEVMKYITCLKNKHIKAGLSIKPDTDVSSLIPYLPYVDLVLVMSVEPGAGGQKFMDSSLEKITWLKGRKEKNGYSYIIEVDGGINDQTATLVKEAGADMVVSGSFITNSEDYKEKVEVLKNC